jgi:hypothetical protein
VWTLIYNGKSRKWKFHFLGQKIEDIYIYRPEKKTWHLSASYIPESNLQAELLVHNSSQKLGNAFKI